MIFLDNSPLTTILGMSTPVLEEFLKTDYDTWVTDTHRLPNVTHMHTQG